jgi:hypothetical protein
MSNLPYTDGKNGNGITHVSEFSQYIYDHPLALADFGYMSSYVPLLLASFDSFGTIRVHNCDLTPDQEQGLRSAGNWLQENYCQFR